MNCNNSSYKIQIKTLSERAVYSNDITQQKRVELVVEWC
jgi:hypothetical protein